MPYVFDERDPAWNEMIHEERLPRIAEFRYLSPPEWGSAPDPVRFSDKIPPAPAPPPQATPVARGPGLLARLLGRRPKVASVPPPSSAEQRRRRDEEARRVGQHWLVLIVGALREIGARSAYCRYDGGNDEGFAWLDHVELRSGERLGPDQLGARLAETNLAERLAAAGLQDGEGRERLRDMRDIARYTFAEECAVKLLGMGFGTGPFYLYGAFTVDLDARIIVDDRNAEPVVQNIAIER